MSSIFPWTVSAIVWAHCEVQKLMPRVRGYGQVANGVAGLATTTALNQAITDMRQLVASLNTTISTNAAVCRNKGLVIFNRNARLMSDMGCGTIYAPPSPMKLLSGASATHKS